MNQEIINQIFSNYSLGEVLSFSKIEKGFSSDNYKIETSTGIFFLKQHRASGGKRLESIEQAEQFFVLNNIPVISPIKNKKEKLHIVINDIYYVIYPFVSGIQYELGNVPISIILVIAEKLADIHLLTKDGIPNTYTGDTYFKLPSKEKTLSEIENILRIIKPIKDIDREMIKGLKLKKQLIEENNVAFEKINYTDTILCLGDFYPDNIFFNESGEIKYIFDLDMAGPAPRLFDFIYSCIHTCFWFEYTEQNIDKAKAFVHTYYKKYPFNKEDFENAFELFYLKSLYSTWRERAHYLENDLRNDSMYKKTITALIYLKDNKKRLLDILFP